MLIDCRDRTRNGATPRSAKPDELAAIVSVFAAEQNYSVEDAFTD